MPEYVPQLGKWYVTYTTPTGVLLERWFETKRGALLWLEGQRRRWERKGRATPQPR